MTRDLTGKRAILTGASGGIGRATAAALVKAGARVALASRNADALERSRAVCESRGGDDCRRANRHHATRGSQAARRDRGRRQFGGLDLLINNAGVGSWGHFATSTPEIMRQVMEVNFFGPVELTRVAMPHLTNGNQSAVVNVTSMCGRKGMPAWPEYSASKFALVGMSEALARRVRPVRRGRDYGRSRADQQRLPEQLAPDRTEGRPAVRDGMKPEIPRDGDRWTRSAPNRREVVLGGEARRCFASTASSRG